MLQEDKDSHHCDAVLIAPLVILGALASFIAGLGIQKAWLSQAGQIPIWYLEQIVSAALHASWIICAWRRRSLMVTRVCWCISLYFCRNGLNNLAPDGSPFSYALVLEIVPLLLASCCAPHLPWAERLARWRRARSEITVQLRMGDGLLSWLSTTVRQFLTGSADTPAGLNHRRFMAELADSEHRLRVRISGLVLPEQLRQSILSCATELVSQAQTASARLAVELEQHALTAAAACRDQVEALEDISHREKEALAGQCESLLLGLIHLDSEVSNLSKQSISEGELYEPVI